MEHIKEMFLLVQKVQLTLKLEQTISHCTLQTQHRHLLSRTTASTVVRQLRLITHQQT